jgi:hypothetical protein
VNTHVFLLSADDSIQLHPDILSLIGRRFFTPVPSLSFDVGSEMTTSGGADNTYNEPIISSMHASVQLHSLSANPFYKMLQLPSALNGLFVLFDIYVRSSHVAYCGIDRAM